METPMPVTDGIQSKNVIKTFSITTSEVLKELAIKEELPAGGLWALASVETIDIAGDVVKISGIDWSDYHNPPTTHLKITADHNTGLPNGEPSVVGRVERFVKTTVIVEGKETPALAFYFTWSRDGDGNITDLAKKYADLYSGRYMESFSVGLLSNDYKPNKQGGLDYNTSLLYHIAACAVPANPYATVLRSVEISKLEQQIKELHSTLVAQSVIINKVMELASANPSNVETLFNSFSTNIQKNLEVLTDRLDMIEAVATVTKSNKQSMTSNSKQIDTADLQDVSKLLKKYSGTK